LSSGPSGPVAVNGSTGPIVVPVAPPPQGSLLGNNVSPFFPATRAPNSNTQFMTTAAFAQTKFGSTKLKTSSKRTHRMSPTEFSNYIKQKQQQQQQQQQQVQQQAHQSKQFILYSIANRVLFSLCVLSIRWKRDNETN